MFNKLVVAALLLVSQLAVSGTAVNGVANDRKRAPLVTFDRVENLFGNNLTFAKESKKLFLLAVAMDHTSKNSTHRNEQIGVPFIVAGGADYWVGRLGREDYPIDVLVNNAILLLFGKENIEGSEAAGLKLLNAASKKGYWPARYYIAEHNIAELLQEPNDFSVVPSSETFEKATETMSILNSCSEMGFAPCQYRIGFWLMSTEETFQDGLKVLRAAINTTVLDRRYIGILDNAVALASQEIVKHGAAGGLNNEAIAEYSKLMEAYIKKASVI